MVEKSRKKIILVDMDSTIVDFNKSVLEKALKTFHIPPP